MSVPGLMDARPITDILLLSLQMPGEHHPAEWVCSCKGTRYHVLRKVLCAVKDALVFPSQETGDN